MSHDTIKRMFESRLKTYADEKGLRISYHNAKFTPIANETYLRSNLMPSITGSRTLGGDHRLYVGVYQITIITPKDTGTTLAANMMEELEELFPLYVPIYEQPETEEGLMVQPMTPFMSPEGFVEGTTFLLPASFEYRSDTPA